MTRNRGGGDRDAKGRSSRRRGRRRDEHGQFARTVDREDVLAVFEAVEGPVVTTSDVSDGLGITTESARGKLEDLVRDGSLRRRKTGRTAVYWRATESESESDARA